MKKKYLFIAVKPEYANKLISGEKDIELRKTKPHVQAGDYAIIYFLLLLILGHSSVNQYFKC